jgi:pyrimidine-nucleoside phosphorylase
VCGLRIQGLTLSTTRLDPPVIIARKRDGEELRPDEFRAFLAGYLDGQVAEEQMSAFLMAGLLRGFSREEAVVMTEAMITSGETVDLSDLRGPTIDKHSTGGVGDTCTLIVAPILAACGAQVAKLSGRGLGHTGGTLDKLESIPGCSVDLTAEEFHQQVSKIGIAVAAATQDIVPLDKRLYALRDVTGTVPSSALIASSVMSKKLAGGAEHIVLDVKTGNGALIVDPDQAFELAELCVAIAEAHGRKAAALVTDMSQPLSHAVGNAIEVAHAVEVLTGQRGGRFRDLCLEIAATGLALTGRGPDDAYGQALAALEGGRAAEVFSELVAAQGGNPEVMDRPWEVLPTAPVVADWAPGAGRVGAMDTRGLGELASGLGAGRKHKEDDIDPRVGFEMHVGIGDVLAVGQPAVRIHAANEYDRDWALGRLPDLIEISDEGQSPPPLVHARIGGARAR